MTQRVSVRVPYQTRVKLVRIMDNNLPVARGLLMDAERFVDWEYLCKFISRKQVTKRNTFFLSLNFASYYS